jgi:hypothetical protein
MNRLSRNFSLDEFLRSRTASRLDIDMTPEPWVIDNLRHLAREVLQPARDRIRQETGASIPLMITSGWRPAALNSAVGGAPDSAHLMGLAADVIAPKFSPLELAGVFLREALEGAPVAQIIHEFGQWVHVSAWAPDAGGPYETLTSHTERGRIAYAGGLLPVDPRTRTLI